MIRRSRSLAALVLAGLTVGALEAPAAESVWTGPVLASPGGRGREGRVATGCPTFSWSLMPSVESYRLTVYAVGAAGDDRAPTEEPLLRVELPGGVTSWTPELGECLPAGRYGWAVAAVAASPGVAPTPRWSRPAVFRVMDSTPAPRRGGRSAQTVEGAPAIAPPAPASSAAPPGRAPRSISAPALFTPPACTVGGEMFDDVPASDQFCRWIEQLARDGISAGCGNGNFCPDQPVTRRQLALIVEKAMRGTLSFAPAPGGPRATTVDDPVNFVGGYTSIAIGTDGLPIISHYDGSSGALKVAHCNDVACAGANEAISTVTSTPGGAGFSSSLAIGADGLPIISYLHYENGITSLKVAHCNDLSCAGANETLNVIDPTTYAFGPTSLAIGADGLPVISYTDFIARTLKVVHCDDVACAPGGETITVVDDPEHLVLAYSLAIGTDGLPIISYNDQTAFNLQVAHCDDLACAPGGETTTTVDSENAVGSGKIAIGSDGLPIIAYWDSTANALKVAHCDDLACAGENETITTVVGSLTSGDGGHHSMAIGADGLPVISYRDAGNLRVVHCNDIACVGGDETIATADSGNALGNFNAIAIGTDGVPIISYNDETAHSLKVVHCGTLTCAQ